MSIRMSDEQLDDRFRAFMAQRAEEVAADAPGADVVAAHVAERVGGGFWTARGWFVPASMRLGIVLLLAVLALIALALVGARVTSRPLTNGPIVFLDNADILSVGSDGAALHRLDSVQPADPGADCCAISFSPDGSRLLIATGSSIDVMNADGTGRHEVVREEGLGAAAWSPDGRQIVVGVVADGFTQLAVVDAEGGTPRRITHGLLFAGGPATWSHDGKWISFGGARTSISEQALFVVAPDGTGLRQLGPTAPIGASVAGSGPTWSPDDRSIAFDVGLPDAPSSEIYTVDLNSAESQALIGNGLQGMTPTWSPDGAWIAFSGWQTGGQMADLYVVRPDGSGARRLEVDVSWNDHPWSFDGTFIAFAHQLAETIGAPSTGYADLREIRPDGSGERVVAAHEVHGTITWPATVR